MRGDAGGTGNREVNNRMEVQILGITISMLQQQILNPTALLVPESINKERGTRHNINLYIKVIVKERETKR